MAITNYDKCSLLLPMDGTNGGTTFTDWSPTAKAVTANGNAVTSTAQSKYYGSSGYFDGNGDYLTLASSADFNFGTGNWTISVWRYLLSLGSSGYSHYFSVQQQTTLAFKSGATQTYLYANSATRIGDGTAPTLNVWQHIEVCRDGDNLRIFLDGVLKTTVAISTATTFGATSTADIGRAVGATSEYVYGYLQDLKVVKGAALHSANFTPPSRLIGTISGNTRDYNGSVAQRTVVAIPRTTPTRAFTTSSDPGTGNYSLRAPAAECSAIMLANEPTLYNDLVHRATPE